MSAATIERTSRPDTQERWSRALDRAHVAGVQVYQCQGSGQWIATSSSDPNAAYECDGVDCTCAAALLGGDPVCCHRAAVREKLAGGSDSPEPPCTRCDGTGRYADALTSWDSVICDRCNGGGHPGAGVEKLAA